MAMQVSKRGMTHDAVSLAIEWKQVLHRELLDAAERIAGDADVLTAEHLHQALPAASERLIEIAREQSSEATDVHRRSA